MAQLRKRENLNTHRILDNARIYNAKPSVIAIRQNNDGSYQWWGDDGRQYSVKNNSLSTITNLATISPGLVRR